MRKDGAKDDFDDSIYVRAFHAVYAMLLLAQDDASVLSIFLHARYSIILPEITDARLSRRFTPVMTFTGVDACAIVLCRGEAISEFIFDDPYVFCAFIAHARYFIIVYQNTPIFELFSERLLFMSFSFEFRGRFMRGAIFE